MTVSLLRPYAGYVSGAVVTLGTDVELSLIAQGLAVTAAQSATTVGAATANLNRGVAAIAAGSSSVVITNNLVDANTSIFAVVQQSTADTTLLRVERIVPANGSFTIFGTAAATATTLIAWSVTIPYGMTIRP